MSLRVWMPLNGDLRNQGLSILTATNSGATIDNNGKIGKCYSFTTSQLIQATLPNQVTSPIGSLSCWVKFNAFPASGAFLCLLKLGNVGTGFGSSFLSLWISNGSIYVVVKGKDPVEADYITNPLSTNIWYHLTITYDGTIAKIYSNGIQIYSKSLTGGSLTSANYFLVGANNAGTAISPNPNYGLNGYLNDVRYYDHALSAREVEEISKGLILHYKLDDERYEGTINRCSPTSQWWWINSGSGTKTENNTTIPNPPTATSTFSVLGTSASSLGIGVGTTVVNLPSKTISASVYVWLDGPQSAQSIYLRSSKTDSVACYLKYKGSQNPQQWPKQKWIRVTADNYTTPSDATTFWICTYVTQTDEFRALNGWQIEEKDHVTPYVRGTRTPTTVYDSSGYGNHGSIVGSLSAAASSPKFSHAMIFNGSNSAVAAGRGAMVTDAITISCWGYMDDWSGYTRILSCTQNGGWNFEPQSDTLQFACGTGVSSNTYKTVRSITLLSTFTAGWHHIVGTYDGLALKLYIDGILDNSTTAYSTKTPLFYHETNGIFVGAESYTTTTTPTTPYFNGKISDVRIYATALNASQVADLYRSSKIVNSDGTVSPREV